jgi:hypothetical protein
MVALRGARVGVRLSICEQGKHGGGQFFFWGRAREQAHTTSTPGGQNTPRLTKTCAPQTLTKCNQRRPCSKLTWQNVRRFPSVLQPTEAWDMATILGISRQTRQTLAHHNVAHGGKFLTALAELLTSTIAGWLEARCPGIRADRVRVRVKTLASLNTLRDGLRTY